MNVRPAPCMECHKPHVGRGYFLTPEGKKICLYCEINRMYDSRKDVLDLLQIAVNALNLTLGFTVSFRQDNKCYDNHQDVGKLYAVIKEALTALGVET